MTQLSEMLDKVLQALYPDVLFDTEGLVGLLLPCAVIVIAGLIVSVVIKLPRSTRRFASLPVVIALIIAIAASTFFPVSLTHAGQGITNRLEQMAETREMPS